MACTLCVCVYVRVLTLQVKVAMAYMRLVASPTTDAVALSRVINLPTRGLGEPCGLQQDWGGPAHGN